MGGTVVSQQDIHFHTSVYCTMFPSWLDRIILLALVPEVSYCWSTACACTREGMGSWRGQQLGCMDRGEDGGTYVRRPLRSLRLEVAFTRGKLHRVNEYFVQFYSSLGCGTARAAQSAVFSGPTRPVRRSPGPPT